MSVTRKLLPYLLAITAIASLAFSTACRRENKLLTARLTQAEALIDTDLTRADSLIYTIDTLQLVTDNQKALYTLVKAQIEYKSHRDHSTPEEFDPVCSHFKEKGDNNHLIRALLMQSAALFVCNDLQNSIKTAMEANTLALQEKDTLYIARSYEQIADIYSYGHNVSEHLRFLDLAIKWFKLAGKEKNYYWCLINKALALCNDWQHQASLALLDSIIPCINPADSMIICYAYENKLRVETELGKLTDAAKSLEKIEKFNAAGEFIKSLRTYFDYYISSGNLQQARMVRDSIINSTDNVESDISSQWAIYLYAKATGQTDTALCHLEKVHRLNEIALVEILKESTVKAESEYNAAEAKKKEHKINSIKQKIIIAIALVIAVFLTLYLIYRNHIKIKERQIQENIGEIHELFSTLNHKDEALHRLGQQVAAKNTELIEMNRRVESTQSSLESLTDKLNTLYRQQFLTLNRLSNEYFAKKDASDKIKLSLFKEIEAEILKLRSRKSIEDLENSLNHYNDHIMEKFKTDFPDMKHSDYVFVVLAFAGLSAKAISVISDITTYNFYAKRQRLRAKIEASDAANKAQYLRFLE